MTRALPGNIYLKEVIRAMYRSSAHHVSRIILTTNGMLIYMRYKDRCSRSRCQVANEEMINGIQQGNCGATNEKKKGIKLVCVQQLLSN